MSSFPQNQRKLTEPITFNNNISLRNSLEKENNKKLKSHKSLNKLGRKKTVSFSTNISIINVDNWKSYNIDVSEVGGCMAWDAKKNEEKRKKHEEEEKKKKLEEDGCQCIIY